jgi:tetratricopeptide (TPR) repeat protein
MKALLALLLLALPVAARQGAPMLSVNSVYIDGEMLVTVEVRDKQVDDVVAAIAREAGLTLSGFEPGKHYPQVAIELNQRPLDMVLEFVLGSVGFEYDRAGSDLRVHGHERDRTSLLNRAGVAYMRATNSFPRSLRAPAARLAQGWLAEQKSDLTSALNMYQLVPESYPDSPEVADAYYHMGRISEELGNWRDAVQAYDKLSQLSIEHNFHAEQRLGRARCDIALGDPVGALYKLKTLDLNMPARTDVELAERTLVRARAHNAQRDYKGALIDLDQIDQLNSPLVMSPEYLRATAISLEGLGLYGPAGQSWLAYSKSANGADRQSALETAIELFLQADDEVNALFAVRFAEKLGATPKLDLLKKQLDARLGLDELEITTDNSPAQRLERAQAAWNDGDVGGAYGELGPMIANLSQLTDAQRTAASSLWARCLDKLEGIQSAVSFLRSARPSLRSLESRKKLDLTAASLFEARDMYDEAVDAYGGIYR